jgi:hypothetical protein
MTQRPVHPPPFILELQARGESLRADRLWDAHLASCEQCAATLRTMAEEDDGYRRDPRAKALAERLHAPRRRPVSIPRRYRWAAVVLPLGAAAAFLLWPRSQEREFDLTAKGGGLEIALERDGRVTNWEGAPLREGDRLQLALSTGGPTQVVVFAREGSELTQLYPEGHSRSASPAPGAHAALGGSIGVDGHPLRLYLFESSTPFDIEPLRAALAAGAVSSFAGKSQIVDLPGSATR